MTNMDYSDSSVPARKGEELDTRILGDYLRKQIPGLEGELVIEQFPSGYSNLSYLIRVGEKEMVLRRPPVGAKRIKAGHDMRREFTVLSKLHPVYPPAPKPLVYCDDESLIGAVFYVMERIRGVIIRKDFPEGLQPNPATTRKMCESLIDNLIVIHSIDYKSIGLTDFGKPDGFLLRQVEGWAERWEKSKTEELPEVAEIVPWFRNNIPQSPSPTLIHNDYKYDNIILDPRDLTRIIGVLDWEMSTIGDPLFDLGVALSYWVQKDDPEEVHVSRMVPTHVEGSLTRREVMERYAAKTGRDMSNMPFYYSFALFKLAVIAQQIYYRFSKGFSNDERFGLLLAGVKVLIKYSHKAIETQSIL